MRGIFVSLLAMSALGFGTEAVMAAEDGRAEEVNAYERVADWPRLVHPFYRAGYALGSQGGIFAESPNRIFLASRGELKLPDTLPTGFNGLWGSLADPGKQGDAPYHVPELRNCIMVVDANGKLIESWTQWDHLFEGGLGPHSIGISPYDPERHVWVTDSLHNQVYEFTNDGRSLVRTLGVRDVPGADGAHFWRPTDIAWLPDGSFFVSDGEGNARVAKFDKNGKFLLSWGKSGTAPGEFNMPHAIAVGPDRHVYVADRMNKRIQVFDENGTFLSMWPDVRTTTVMMSANGHLWLYDEERAKYVEYDLKGNLVSSFVIPGAFAHQIAADEQGNMYAAGSYDGLPYKMRPKPNADPKKLMRAVALMGKEVSAPGPVNFSGTWKLTKAPPEKRTDPNGFGAAASVITIAQTATELTLTGGMVKLVFKLDGTEAANANAIDPATKAVAKTRARWDDSKLILLTQQQVNQDLDTLSLSGNTLTIERYVNGLPGLTYVVTLTYEKSS